MNTREFIYIGEPLPKVDSKEKSDFLLNMQKAMIESLVERKLLTVSQGIQVYDLLVRQLNRK